MNNVAYLNQISSNAKSQPTPKESLLDNKIFRIVVASVVGLTLILLILSFFRNLSNNSHSRFEQLYLRTNTLISSTDAYTPLLKSSALRSAGASFSSTLKGTSVNLADFYESENISDKNISAKINSLETDFADSLNLTLRNGQLNGILDRTYAHEMAYQISLYLALLDSIKTSVKDSATLETIDNTATSLDQLYSTFNNFSDAKK